MSRELETIKLAVIAENITPNPALLSTRLYGKRFFMALCEKLRHTGGAFVAALSFEGIELMDASFADEVFGSLVVARVRKEATAVVTRPFFITAINSAGLENLTMALDTRPDREELSGRDKPRNCVLPVRLENSDVLQLTGKAEEHVRQTFELLGRRRELNARQLANALELNINAASTRLKVLADLGLAVRSEIRDAQGKQYVYGPLI